ncbi:MAG: peptidase [Candidatus Omnitrophota bacterium]|jgi:proteic killer suppression protein|nr:MAG: peptidase [Candidatus Omnitrophota bacterium]
MIRSFRHKGLRRLYEKGDTKDLPAGVIVKIENMLGVIDQAKKIEEIGLFPGWRLHNLKGGHEGSWSLTVTGNWRLIFRFENGDAFDLDYKDYH